MDLEEKPHSLQLKDRKILTVSGVSEVIRFEENMVALETGMGTLLVQGQQLQLKKLSPEGGEVCVEGRIGALTYEEPRRTDSWWQRLLG